VTGVHIATRYVAPEDPDAVPLLLHRPETLGPRAPVLVCVHGYTRQPLDHLEAMAPAAACAGFAMLAPLFRDSGAHRMYQQLVHPRRGTRSDLALLDAIDRLAQSSSLDVDRVHLFGYSGGAQFVHRLALLHPQRVASLGIGAAGWYTWPDHERPWPHGLAGAPTDAQQALDIDAFLRLPMALWVGERDNKPDTYLRDDPALNAQQGSHRLERASRWAAAVREQAARRDIEARVSLESLPKAGHDFLACHRKAGLGDRAVAHAARFHWRAADTMPATPVPYRFAPFPSVRRGLPESR
jgi:pimeloyl-ACP methyl ester carboxylesterase